MNSSLNLRVSTRTPQGQTSPVFEGTVTIAGLRPTKLVKADKSTTYTTRSAVVNAANTIAKRFGYTVTVEGEARKAAKKRPAKKARSQPASN